MRPDLAAQIAFRSRPSSLYLMNTAQYHLVRASVTSIPWQILHIILKDTKRCSQKQHFLCYITRWKHASPRLESFQHSNHDGSSRGARQLKWGVQLSSCSSHTVRSLACLSKLCAPRGGVIASVIESERHTARVTRCIPISGRGQGALVCHHTIH